MSSNIRITRICKECQLEFTARTTITKFCSHTCNRKHYKRNVKAVKIENSDIETAKIIRDQNPITSKDYLTIKEVCSYIGISRTTLWRLLKNRTIQFVKLGDRTIIKKSDLDQALNRI